jgi:hypothetical protein
MNKSEFEEFELSSQSSHASSLIFSGKEKVDPHLKKHASNSLGMTKTLHNTMMEMSEKG